MKKNLKWTIVGLVSILILLGPGRDLLVRVAVENGVHLITGLNLHIGKLRVALLGSKVDIVNLRLHNPKDFQDKIMVDMPEISVDYRIAPLLKGQVYLDNVVIHLKEFSVVKNKDGVLNLDSLKTLQPQKQKAPETKKKQAKLNLQIDSLRLIIEKVYYKDYSTGGEPAIKTFSLDIDEEFKNINDPNKLVSLILFKVLTGTTIGRLVDVDMTALKSTAADALATGQKVVSAAGDKAKVAAGKFSSEVGKNLGTMKEKTSNATEQAKETAGAAKEKAGELLNKLPFGD